MRVWMAAFGLALEPILGSKLVRIAFMAGFYAFARLQVDAALQDPMVDSAAIFAAITIGFLKTLAVAIALSASWAIPATIWTRLSIARSNRVKPKQ